jgi:hypothetical protein
LPQLARHAPLLAQCVEQLASDEGDASPIAGLSAS